MSFLKSAKFITDVEDGCDYVEVEYTKYVDDERRYETFVDYYNTIPLGDWIELTSLKQNIPLEKFLDTMVEKTVEVLQKMCEIVLEQTECSVRLMYASKILTPSFKPPVVDIDRFRWQRTLVEDFCMHALPEAIYDCQSKWRLEKFFNVVKMIQQEL